MQRFDGIDEKLKRAEESINNLYCEMDRFFKEGDYPIFPENDQEQLAKAIEYHKNRVIPPRFGVLTGEIIHQLRSCFDHIVWHFSLDAIDSIKNPRQVGFPVFEERPANHKTHLFKQKIQGVTDLNARALIERLQPYNAADPLDDPLWIIHDFDIVDKHKELIFCVRTKAIVLPRDMHGDMECYQREHPELNPAQVARHVKSPVTSLPCISFKTFGRREIEPVTEGLIKLFNYTINVAKEFKAL
jgi:hypothetical protein